MAEEDVKAEGEVQLLDNRKSSENSNDDEAEYEVEAILGVRAFLGENLLKYRIRWVGYSEEYDSWEPEENLGGAEEALESFKLTHALDVQCALQKLEKSREVVRSRKGQKAARKRRGVSEKGHSSRLSSSHSQFVETSSNEEDETLLTTKKKLPARQSDSLSSSDMVKKEGQTPRLEFTPRKRNNAWMYKDLDDETDDDDRSESKLVTADTKNQQSTSEVLERGPSSDAKVIQKKASAEGQCSTEANLVASNNSRGNEVSKFEGHFISCVKMSNGVFRFLCTSGSTRSLITAKEAFDRYGFELVEFLLSFAECD